jgi:hypothetical protein
LLKEWRVVGKERTITDVSYRNIYDGILYGYLKHNCGGV